MNRRVKIFIIIGCVLIAVGGIVAAIGYRLGGLPNIYWGEKIEGTEYNKDDLVTLDSVEVDDFSNIDLVLDDYCDLEVVTGDGYFIQCANFMKGFPAAYEVKDDTLTVRYQITHNQFISFGGDDYDTKITVTVPEGAELSSVELKSEGEVTIGNIAVDRLLVNTDYADNIILDNVEAAAVEIQGECDNLQMTQCTLENADISTDCGNITILDCEGTGHWRVEAESGDVSFAQTQIETMECTLAFGDLTMEDVVSNGLTLELENGDANLTGDFRRDNIIYMEYGDVTMNLVGEESEYGYDLKTEYGDIVVDSENISGTIHAKNKTPDQIVVTSESGGIKLDFGKTGSVE